MPFSCQVLVHLPLSAGDVINLAGDGPPLVAPLACAHLPAPERGEGKGPLLLAERDQLRAQDAEGHLAVLQMGSLGLRPDDKASRQMADVDRSIALVPVLPSWPLAAARGDFEIALENVWLLRPGHP